jgi:transcriptional regulator with XRE-family HTH domain
MDFSTLHKKGESFMYESTIVAEVIKNRAKKLNVQLKDMLHDLNLNKNTLSNMYKGSMLKGDSLARIADYLDCSTDYLLGRTDNPEINR